MDYQKFVTENKYHALSVQQESLRQKSFKPACSNSNYTGSSKTLLGLV